MKTLFAVIVILAIIVAGISMQVRNDNHDVMNQMWHTADTVIDSLSVTSQSGQSCVIYTYANNTTETVCQ